jgi:hypothetical protein
MEVVARELSSHVSPQRVFSVFAAEPVTRAFANAWRDITGVGIARGRDESETAAEYYAALLTYCDKESFKDRRLTINPNLQYDIRPACMADLPVVADLCYGFAALSVSTPYGIALSFTHLHSGTICVDDMRSS